jgi:transposase
MQDLLSQQSDIKARIKQGEKELVQCVREQFMDLFELLTSIRGVGKKSAVMFIVLTQAFTRFEDAKQFTSYLGLSSFITTSGTSVRGSGSISKMGNSRMRQLLYMGALTAKRSNKACMQFADRLKANGKPPKVVRVAVANKLVRQAFAVIKNQEAYSESYA